MGSRKENKREIILSIENRLNELSLKQEQRAFVEKAKAFGLLLKLGIISYNEKVGPYYNGYWLKGINGTNWTFKVAKELGIPRTFYLELINERMATALGIHTIKSKIVKLSLDSNFYAIMSEDYRVTKYKVISGKEIIKEYLDYLTENGYFEERFGVKKIEDVEENRININSLPVIYQALTYHFTNRAGNPEEPYIEQKSASVIDIIYNELKKRYIYAYITMQKDFHLGNWEILENQNGAYLTPMYDLEMSMQDNFYDKKNTSLRASMDGSLSIDQDFEQFINSNPENKTLVRQMHYMITPSDILSFMENCEIEVPAVIKKQVLTIFTNHFLNIENMLTNKNKLTKDSK